MCLHNFGFFFIFIVSLKSTIIIYFSVFVCQKKKRIGSGYYLYLTGLKIKKQKEELKTKRVYDNLGAMFAETLKQARLNLQVIVMKILIFITPKNDTVTIFFF